MASSSSSLHNIFEFSFIFVALLFAVSNCTTGAEVCSSPSTYETTTFINQSSCPAEFVFDTASSSYQYDVAANVEGGPSNNIWDSLIHENSDERSYPAIPSIYGTATFNRSSFPADFVFGTGSSAYQYEGAANVDGKGPSIWDTFTHRYPEKISDRSNGDVALDSYNKYKEDIKIMKEMGLDAYRFSIAWTRILPKGKLNGGVNQKGVAYYNNFINELLVNGIQPYVTLFHWDVPQSLEDEYGGFLSPKIVDDFRDYVDLCFKEFGDRVKHWITVNEPSTFCNAGYTLGIFAPGRCSEWQKLNCTGGDSATEPYLAAHHLILAHAVAVQLYKHKYQEYQKGKIGITLFSYWFEPYSNAEHNVNAAKRSVDFMLGWFLDPIVNGDYPYSMRSIVGSRLPKFTKEQYELVKGSFDFIGINYYTTYYARDSPKSNNVNASYTTDPLAKQLTARNGISIGPQAGSNWLFIYPKGIRELLLYVKINYGNPPLYITENGVSEFNNDATMSVEQQLVDPMRIEYYHGHLSYLNRAIKEGANVNGYFAWSLLDDFEWSFGYTVRFGINYVDYKNGLKRYPKHSSRWFREFLKKY